VAFIFFYLFIFTSIIVHINNENKQKSNQYNYIILYRPATVYILYVYCIVCFRDRLLRASIFIMRSNSIHPVGFIFLFIIIFPNCDDEYFMKPSIIQSLVYFLHHNSLSNGQPNTHPRPHTRLHYTVLYIYNTRTTTTITANDVLSD